MGKKINKKDPSEKKPDTGIHQDQYPLSDFYDFINEIVFWIDRDDYSIKNVNFHALKSLGYTRNQLLSLTMKDFLSPKDLTYLESAIKTIIHPDKTSKTPTLKLTFHTQNRDLISVQTILQPIPDPDSTLFLLIAKPVEDIMSQDFNLKEIHHFYQEAIRNANGVPYLRLTKNTYYDFIGENCVELFGIPVQEISSTRIDSLTKEKVITDTESPIDYQDYCREVDQGIRPYYQCDLRIITPQGKEKWVRDRSVIYKDPISGEVVGYLGILQDITFEKNSLNNLKKQNNTILAIRKCAEIFFQHIDWKNAIPETMEKLGTAWNLTQTFILENKDLPTGDLESHLVHMWSRKKYDFSFNPDTVKHFHSQSPDRDRMTETLRQGFVLCINLSDCTAEEQTFLDQLDVVSLILIPVFIENRWWGTIGLKDAYQNRTWNDFELDTMEIISDLFSNAIQRSLTTMKLHQLNQTYSDVIVAAKGIPYQYDYVASKYTFLGPNVEQILGIEFKDTSFEHINKHILKFQVADPGYNGTFEEYLVVFRSGKWPHYKVDLLLQTDSGETRWIHDSCIPIYDEVTQDIIQTIGIFQDITDRKRNESVLEYQALLSQEINTSQSPKEVGKILAHFTKKLLSYDAFIFELYNAGEQTIQTLYLENTVTGSFTPSENTPEVITPRHYIPDSILLNKSLLMNREIKDNSNLFIPYGDNNQVSLSMIFVPIRMGENIIGTVSLHDYQPNHFKSTDLELFESMVNQCGSVLARVLANQSLKESEDKYRILVEVFPHFLIIVKEGYIQYANPSALKILGHNSLNDVIGKDMFQCVADWEKERLRSLYWEKLAGEPGFPEVYNSWFKKYDETTFPVQLIVRNISYAGHKAHMLIAMDISDRIKAEQSILLRESFMSGLVEIQNLLLHSQDPYKDIPQVLKILGRTTDISRVSYFENTSPPQHHILYKRRLEWCNVGIISCLHNPILNNIVYDDRFILFQNTIIKEGYFSGNIYTVPSDIKETMLKFQVLSFLIFPIQVNQTILGFLELDDCTETRNWEPYEIDLLQAATAAIALSFERYQVENALKESEKYFRLLTENSTDTIIRLGLNYRIIYISPACYSMIGYEPEELSGQNPETFLHPNDVQKFSDIHQDISSTGKSNTYQLRFRHKKGHYLWIESSTKGIYDESGNITEFQLSARDINERINLESQLRHAQKMEVVGTMARGIAHDYNNILTAILGNSELLLRMAELTPFVEESVKEIYTSADRGAKLTKQLLLHARKASTDFISCRLNDILDNSLIYIRRSLEQNPDIELRIIRSASHDQIQADPVQIQQVLISLTTNAYDAMTSGGTLHIKTEDTEINKDYCDKNPNARMGHFIKITVQDNGTGIPEDILQHIFEPFFTTKEVGQGPGLGLAAVYGIIRNHKGWIEVETEVNMGTVFIFYIPIHEENN